MKMRKDKEEISLVCGSWETTNIAPWLTIALFTLGDSEQTGYTWILGSKFKKPVSPSSQKSKNSRLLMWRFQNFSDSNNPVTHNHAVNTLDIFNFKKLCEEVLLCLFSLNQDWDSEFKSLAWRDSVTIELGLETRCVWFTNYYNTSPFLSLF